MFRFDITSVSDMLVLLAMPGVIFVIAANLRQPGRAVRGRGTLYVLSVMLGVTVIGLAIYILMNPHILTAWVVNMFAVAKASLVLLALGFVMLFVALACWRRVVEGLAATLIMLWVGFGLLVIPAFGCDGIDRSSALSTYLHCPDYDVTASLAGTARSGAQPSDVPGQQGQARENRTRN